MRRFIQLAISLLFIGLILRAVFVRFDMRRTAAAVVGANPALLLGAIGLLIGGYFLRAARWQIWERSLGYWDSFRLILIGFMGNNVLPARLGEILRAHCAAAKTDSERGRTTAVASIGAERVLDGLVLAVFGLIACRLVAVDARLRGALLGVSLAFACLTLGLVVSLRFHQYIRSVISAGHRKFPGHITAFAQEKAIQLLDGLMPLGTARRMISAILATGFIWAVELAAYFCFGRSVWAGMNLGAAFLALTVVNFASLIPLTMGGIGTVEAAAPAYLVSSGVPAYLALAMVLLVHAVQYLFTTITGGILYLAGGFYRIPLDSPKSGAARPKTSQQAASLLSHTESSLSALRATVGLQPAARDNIELSIVIPAYNEQARLPRTVLETIHWCKSKNLAFELLLVDDGSRDETLALSRLFEESDSRVRAIACPHMGKGATVRMGVLNAKGRFVLFMDADGATPLDEIPKLLAAIEHNDVAIGSRSVQRPGEVEVKTSFLRRFIGRTFAFLVNLFAFDGVADTQCGFKMFRREAAREIFSRQKIVGFAFDVEILYLARRLSLSIAEIPVNWVAQPGSKVNLVTDSIKMLWDISHIRWLHRNVRELASGAQRQLAI